ncbi:hypothetical protein NC651_020389 [Populus alba x Populus x berolinensis]|nr:hypothetical protein NC651_020389 [Populus alba x Populus x berolinensis]
MQENVMDSVIEFHLSTVMVLTRNGRIEFNHAHA